MSPNPLKWRNPCGTGTCQDMLGREPERRSRARMRAAKALRRGARREDYGWGWAGGLGENLPTPIARKATDAAR